MKQSFSDTLAGLGTHFTQDKISVAEIMQALPRRSFEFALLLFAIPIALPLPSFPGLNTVLALPLIFITFQQAAGYDEIWLPRRLKQKTLSRPTFETIVQKAAPWVKRLEYLLRPRLLFLTEGIAVRLIGLCGLILALTIAVPFVFTNTVPSLCIALMALGALMHDGLAVLIGAVLGLSWVILLVLLGELAIETLSQIF